MNFLVGEVHAQITNPALPFAGSGSGTVIIGNLISALVSAFLVMGFVMALFHLMFGAMRWVTASGDKNALQNAQDRMTQAVVGLILLVATWAIMLLVSTILGFQFPNFNLQSITGGGGGGSNSGSTRAYGDRSPGPETGSVYVWTRAGSSCTYGGNTFSYDYDYWCRVQ